jgi:hypothetical protein
MSFFKFTKSIEPYIREFSKINQKWDFVNFERRSEVDNQRQFQLQQIIDEITDKYDKENPVEPCPECGSKRLASLNSECGNYGVCSKSPPLGG